MKKITLETEYGTYTVENKNTGDDINSVMEEIVIPVLMAAGFHPNTVKDEVEYQKEEGWLSDDLEVDSDGG